MTDDQRFTINMLNYELARRDARNRVLLVLAAVAYIAWYAMGNDPLDILGMIWSALSGAVVDTTKTVFMHAADAVLDRIVLTDRS